MKKIVYSLILIATCTVANAQVEHGNMLIKGGTVLTITKGTLEGTDVLVKDGKINQIGKNLTAPAGFKVIDATGIVCDAGHYRCTFPCRPGCY